MAVLYSDTSGSSTICSSVGSSGSDCMYVGVLSDGFCRHQSMHHYHHHHHHHCVLIIKVKRKGITILHTCCEAGLPLSFFSWAYVRQGVYFLAYGMPGVSIFGVRQAFRFLPRCMKCRRGLAMRILCVRLSVRPSNAWIVTKWKKIHSRFLYHAIDTGNLV